MIGVYGTSHTGMHVAIVEDDADQAELFVHWLQLAGHRCAHFPAGEAMMRADRFENFDVIVMDWGLPGISGIDVLKHIRSKLGSALPVLFVTGRGPEEDLVYALRHGADDYLVKPIRRGELLARLDTITRRGKPPRNQTWVLETDGFLVDLEERTVYWHGNMLALQSREFDLAALFFQNVGQVLSREFLWGKVWGRAGTSRVLDNCVWRIRHKLSLVPSNGWRLQAVRGHGYRLTRFTPARGKPLKTTPLIPTPPLTLLSE